MKDTSTVALLKKVAEIRQEIDKRKRKATILFADMVGSTNYKVLKGPILAAEKIWRHNYTIAEIVKKHEGIVVKYLGDGVLATLKGGKQN